MKQVDKSAEQLIGDTPLVRLERIERAFSLRARLYAKIEGTNVGGSVKDRVAKSILDDAAEKGLLQKGGVVVEPTSGNTGIGLALLCAVRGYQAVIVMPDTMSKERIALMQAYGAKVVLTDGKKGMKGAIEYAEQYVAAHEGSLLAGQFTNPANPKAHYEGTGKEIYEALDGKLDYFVAGVGTGGTLTGCVRYFKEQNPAIKGVAVEPSKSPVLTAGKSGAHGIQGIGAGFVPKVLDVSLIDETLTVTDEEAIAFAKEVSAKEGLFVGISSGAALAAAIKVVQREENAGKTVVTLFPDTGSRYLSTALCEFED
ncbi:MAG: cysteine synthase A [Clostridia bacterium]|nr:cysteine synthase A [Clostridia bacterium]